MGLLHIGMDDTDSREGMCTTYLGALLAGELSRLGEVVELKLVRLNPNIPWKTRGNASVAITLETGRGEEAREAVLAAVERYSVMADPNTNPGVVFLEGEVPGELDRFYRTVLHRVVSLRKARTLAEVHSAEVHGYKNGRGMVGALAAVGARLGEGERTYEIIAYRARENWGKERRVGEASVHAMDARTYPRTFNNIDPSSGRILITPRSPCPILFGIRGFDPVVLAEAYRMVEAGEEVERSALYITNQGTDAHLERVGSIAEARPYSSVVLKGTVAQRPRVMEGGHVLFPLTDGRDIIDCAAYEPTRDFRWAVGALAPGDEVEVYGEVTVGRRTINLERLRVLRLAPLVAVENPPCPQCGRRMESAGKGQGFRCRRCKTGAWEKVRVGLPRSLEEGFYQVPTGAMRHLTRPLRLGSSPPTSQEAKW